MTLDSATALNYDLGAPGTVGGHVNDLINVTGNLTLDGTLNINALDGFDIGTYTLINYNTGTLTDNGLVSDQWMVGYHLNIDTSMTGMVNLIVTWSWINGLPPWRSAGFINEIYANFGTLILPSGSFTRTPTRSGRRT